MEYKTQDSDEGERENYYPLNVYCSDCKKDTTKEDDKENIEIDTSAFIFKISIIKQHIHNKTFFIIHL